MPKEKTLKAMILGAEEGTRLRPLTLDTPKSMTPINGIPMIQNTLAWLKMHGITEVAINLNYLGDKIKSFLGDGSQFGMQVVYSEEETHLGTAGGVKKMENFLGERFMVVYGDILTDFNLSEMIQRHVDNKGLATIALFSPPNPSECGIVQMNDMGKIMSFVEKPQYEFPAPPKANAGIYVLEKHVLYFVPKNAKCDFGFDVFPKIIKIGLPMFGYSLKTEDYLIDMGSLEKNEKANEDAKKGRIKLLSLCK